MADGRRQNGEHLAVKKIDDEGGRNQRQQRPSQPVAPFARPTCIIVTSLDNLRHLNVVAQQADTVVGQAIVFRSPCGNIKSPRLENSISSSYRAFAKHPPIPTSSSATNGTEAVLAGARYDPHNHTGCESFRGGKRSLKICKIVKTAKPNWLRIAKIPRTPSGIGFVSPNPEATPGPKLASNRKKRPTK